jgi:hypothetical protein
MGVNTFLLDRRTATLMIGGTKQTAGTLRRFFKLTELDDDRAAELEAAARAAHSPAAVLLMDVSELPLAAEPDYPIAAHLVLGWDEGRGSVTDFGWDYLPPLGYAVRAPSTHAYTLYEERDGLLYPIDATRAREIDLLDSAGRLVRHGQPQIVACRRVKPYIKGYVEADCTLETGAVEKLLTVTAGDGLPPKSWFVGKRPMDVQRYLVAPKLQEPP